MDEVLEIFAATVSNMSFNSLFEMLIDDAAVGFHDMEDPFNSLFEMPLGRLDEPKRIGDR